MMNKSLTISVVIPTRNRAEHLKRLLESLTRCALPPDGDVEVVVADNGSQDHTRTVIELFSTIAPFTVRSVYEPTPGVSRARNAGLEIARGSIVAFLDDDCQVATDWLVSIVKVFAEFPQLTGFFGRVLPSDGAVINPTTLSVKPSMEAEDYRFPCSPFLGHGNNMAYRRQALIDVGGFDALLGPGAPLRCGEDTDLAYRLLRKGAWLRYEPRVLIYHTPRETEEELLAAHQRNAIGLGAYLTKHIAHGDFYAAKTGWWWWFGTWRGYRQAVRQRSLLVKRVKGLYLRWVFYGVWLSAKYGFRDGTGLRKTTAP